MGREGNVCEERGRGKGEELRVGKDWREEKWLSVNLMQCEVGNEVGLS